MWRKTIYYLKYSAYSVRFSPLHFLLYLGKSITFGTVYSWCSTFHMSMMIISGPRDTNEESTFSRQFKKSFLGVFYKGLRRSRQNRKHRAGVAILLNLYRSSTISRVCHFTKSRESVTLQNLASLLLYKISRDCNFTKSRESVTSQNLASLSLYKISRVCHVTKSRESVTLQNLAKMSLYKISRVCHFTKSKCRPLLLASSHWIEIVYYPNTGSIHTVLYIFYNKLHKVCFENIFVLKILLL